MSIQFVKHINKDQNNRVEFLFVNFDYIDGNNLIAKLFEQEFQMQFDKKFDGIFYNIIKLHKNTAEYNLVWHEDVGNYIFCLQQDKESVSQLEQELKIIVNKLNEQISHNIW